MAKRKGRARETSGNKKLIDLDWVGSKQYVPSPTHCWKEVTQTMIAFGKKLGFMEKILHCVIGLEFQFEVLSHLL